MEELTDKTELLWNYINAFGQSALAALPRLLGTIAILIIGIFIARLLGNVVSTSAEKMKVNDLAEKVGFLGFLEKTDIKKTPAQVLGTGFKWVILLLTGLMAAETMGWHMLSQEIGKLIGYLPNLFTALVFFVIGTFIARLVRDFINAATSSIGMSAGRMIGNFVYYFLLIIVALTSLRQMGLDTSIITSNLMIILGTLFFAISVSYAFASQRVLSNILASFYSNKTFNIGQYIVIDGEEGEIVDISNINITLLNTDGDKIIIPSETLIKSKVRIKK